MVKVFIIGITGNTGVQLKQELLSRNHIVGGLARNTSSVAPAENLTVVQGDVDTADLTSLFAGYDVVVNAYAPPLQGLKASEGILAKLVTRTIEASKAAGVKRLFLVGGAGTLFVYPGGGLVIDQPWFPSDWSEIAKSHVDAFELMKASDIDWTVLTPPTYFLPGDKTGAYRIGTDSLVFKDDKASISTGDFALALVDEIEKPQFIRARFTVGY